MNLRPPPQANNLSELRKWCDDLYRFLQYPHFDSIRMVPRTAPTLGDQIVNGTVYQDSGDDTLKVHNGTAFQDTY